MQDFGQGYNMKKIMVFHASEEYFTSENFRKDKVYHTLYDSVSNNVMWLGTETLTVLRPVSEETLRLIFGELVNVELDFYYPT